MPVATPGDTCQGSSHLTDTPPLDDDRANVLTWEDEHQVPLDLVDLVESAEDAAPEFDWQLYLATDEITRSRDLA